MNYHSRVDEYIGHDGFNQNPPTLAAESTSRESLNGMVNLRMHKDDRIGMAALLHDEGGGGLEMSSREKPPSEKGEERREEELSSRTGGGKEGLNPLSSAATTAAAAVTIRPTRESEPKEKPDELRTEERDPPDGLPSSAGGPLSFFQSVRRVLAKYARFVGPGVMISVAYTDPGNYSTDVAAGAAFRFKLLFIVLMANIIAIFLQSLCIKLGTVTGLNLAEHCRAFLPRWLNYLLYVFAEAAIIATDIAEVIGTAIALNILLKIPLVAGCAITIVDVLIILIFYSSDGSMRRIRVFEFFVMALVMGVVICFCIELSNLPSTSVGEIFAGYLPSSTVIQGNGLYLSCGIIGATVMPHSLYLGSGIVQARLYAYAPESTRAAAQAMLAATTTSTSPDNSPSAAADSAVSTHSTLSAKRRRPLPPIETIRSSLRYSITELALSLCTLALFTNSAILILAGASLSNTAEADGADIFTIHELLSTTVAPVAGTIFALALLLSGLSAGIVATLAGQMISEGAIHWTLRPWLRRLLTRSISIAPCIVVAGAVGRDGLGKALNASQVALSVILPVVSAPVIWFTCRAQYMMVYPDGRVPVPVAADVDHGDGRVRADGRMGRIRQLLTFLSMGLYRRTGTTVPSDVAGQVGVNMRNGWITTCFAVAVWLLLAVMNFALLVLVGLGKT